MVFGSDVFWSLINGEVWCFINEALRVSFKIDESSIIFRDLLCSIENSILVSTSFLLAPQRRRSFFQTLIKVKKFRDLEKHEKN